MIGVHVEHVAVVWQVPAVLADLPLQEGQQRPQDVVGERGRRISDSDLGRGRRRSVVDGEVGEQHDDLHEGVAHLIAGTAEQVLAEAAHVIEEHVVGEPGADSGRGAQVEAQDITPERNCYNNVIVLRLIP